MGHRRRSARACTSSSRSRRRATTRPSQTGSRNGLTITKPLTIKGAGASKVTIRPAPALGATLAGTAPYLRDGGGNVVTVSRQSRRLVRRQRELRGHLRRDDRVAGHLRRGRRSRSSTRPGGSPTASSARSSRRPVRLRRGHDQLAAGRRGRHPARGHAREERWSTARVLLRRRPRRRRRGHHDGPLGIKAYGNVDRLARGRPGHATRTASAGRSPAARSPAPLTLTDAETGPDPATRRVRAFSATGSIAARRPDQHRLRRRAGRPATSGAASDHDRPGRARHHAVRGARAAERARRDRSTRRRPARSSIPFGPTTVAWGETIYPVVVAADDFGVKSVALTANGAAGRDRRPHAVRVHLHARVRAHRRPRRC